MAAASLMVHITEDHNEVLTYIYRAIARKKLSFSKNTLLHFDSHPDLLIPPNISASDVFVKEKLFSSISIENWIMPACYAGHISQIVWVKKEWSTQISDGEYIFAIGMDKDTSQIRCSSTEPYFVSELLYTPRDNLANIKDITLTVVTFDSSNSLQTICEVLEELSDNSNIILDIDLDYFSTTNPFLSMYSEKQLDILATLYKFHEETTPELSAARRHKQLSMLSSTIKRLASQTSSASLSNSVEYSDPDSERLDLIRTLVTEEIESKGKVDPETLHEHGCTFDTCGLPHHISTEKEIDKHIADSVELLSRLKLKPRLITIARSSDDDYCPKEQVDVIQEKLLNSLQSLYKNTTITKHYSE